VSETRTFLLEIGFEEIPASYLERAIRPFEDCLSQNIENELTSGFLIQKNEKKFFYTPRRMTVLIENLPDESLKTPQIFKGPPEKSAKDEQGNWTIAAKKFAESKGVNEKDLYINKDENGSYVMAPKEIGGEPAISILARIIPDCLQDHVPFLKNMRWPQSDKITFARPIRWLCCLFGDEVVEFEFAGIKASNKTFGHRFVHPEAVAINHPDEYVQKLRDEGLVLVDPAERKTLIVAELSKAAKELGGALVEDNELVAEVVNLVEYPNVLACDLGGFMDLPREVLQTALAKHQRAFVVQKDGKLIPHFLVVTNAPKLKPDLAKVWFERMAISRLEDADFFIKEDLDKGLEALVEEESRVEWIGGIGSLADKTRFLTELGLQIGANIEKFNPDTFKRGAYLAKADLLSNLVREKEFTSLQGIAGAIYAERLNESPAVYVPIREQYTDTPSSAESAALAIADRLLNICATFAIGKPPRGSSDPFALRRQAGAIMKIITDHKIHLDLPAIIRLALELIGKEEKQKGQIAAFLRDRLELFCKDRGFAYDWVNAVLAVAAHDPYDAYLRLSAFGELDKGEEFRLVAVGQKRVANITKELHDTPAPDTSLFSQKEEKALWDEAERIRSDVKAAVKSRDYTRALELLLSIRPAIDSFFDEVFVMVDDEKIKDNRLNLLAAVRDEFLKVADFSQIVVE
jgi:glycyl-tRNA synthetase beta chain